jgi:peptidoglycan/xylan/chitin deacetylase (PgdA/CDA1 family)
VVLQFDDGTAGHFTHAFPILEKYGLKGSFGVVTGNLGKSGSLAPDQVVKMHRAGHEIHDHTLDHNAAMWGDPGRKAEWAEHTEKSLKILRDLGITTRGWNHPGGKGSQWTSELHEFLLPSYDYVAGRVNLEPEERYNIHWNLRDHPFSLGYGGLGSIPRRDSIDASRDDIAGVKKRIADGIQQGLVCDLALAHGQGRRRHGLGRGGSLQVRPATQSADDAHGRRGSRHPASARVFRRAGGTDRQPGLPLRLR